MSDKLVLAAAELAAGTASLPANENVPNDEGAVDDRVPNMPREDPMAEDAVEAVVLNREAE